VPTGTPANYRPEWPMYPPADRAVVEESGTVKWYNAMKGWASSPQTGYRRRRRRIRSCGLARFRAGEDPTRIKTPRAPFSPPSGVAPIDALDLTQPGQGIHIPEHPEPVSRRRSALRGICIGCRDGGDVYGAGNPQILTKTLALSDVSLTVQQ
jgi:hypothetical protein